MNDPSSEHDEDVVRDPKDDGSVSDRETERDFLCFLKISVGMMLESFMAETGAEDNKFACTCTGEKRCDFGEGKKAGLKSMGRRQ